MAENLWKSLGTIGIAPKGTYNPDTTYYRGHLVSYEGSSYVALKNELTNVTPTDDDINWSLVMKGYNEKIIQATIPSNGWVGDTAPYTQTITVEGISEDDNPVVDIILSDDIETMQAQLEDYGKILKITTGDGNITVYSSDLTTTDLTILMKGVNFATETEIDADKVGVFDTYNIVGNGAGSKGILQTFLDNIGNRIANKIVNSDNFQTILANYIVNNLTTTESNYALDARQGNKNISGTLAALIQSNTDSINVLNTNLSKWHIGNTEGANSYIFTAKNQSFTVLEDGLYILRVEYMSAKDNVFDCVSINGAIILENSLPLTYFNYTSQPIIAYKGDIIKTTEQTADQIKVWRISVL